MATHTHTYNMALVYKYIRISKSPKSLTYSPMSDFVCPPKSIQRTIQLWATHLFSLFYYLSLVLSPKSPQKVTKRHLCKHQFTPTEMHTIESIANAQISPITHINKTFGTFPATRYKQSAQILAKNKI